MPAWNSSSLAFSDHNIGRHESSGLLKNLPTRISKQHIVEHKMFGAKRKGIQIGKRFKKVGKGISKKLGNLDDSVSTKSKGISPSLGEFDKMMSSITSKGSNGNNGNNPNKKKLFQRKSFG